MLRLWAAIAALSVGGCGGSGRSAEVRQSSDDGLAIRSRAIRVEELTVVIEGRWHPIEVTPESPVVANSVQVVCVRAEKRCREELTTVRDGARPVSETFDYRVGEWTKSKLVAVRRQGPTEVSLRVSLTGMAAEKAVADARGGQSSGLRWRLE